MWEFSSVSYRGGLDMGFIKPAKLFSGDCPECGNRISAYRFTKAARIRWKHQCPFCKRHPIIRLMEDRSRIYYGSDQK